MPHYYAKRQKFNFQNSELKLGAADDVMIKHLWPIHQNITTQQTTKGMTDKYFITSINTIMFL